MARKAVRKKQRFRESTGRLAGARPQRRSRFCAWTAVHLLIGDGFKLFFK